MWAAFVLQIKIFVGVGTNVFDDSIDPVWDLDQTRYGLTRPPHLVYRKVCWISAS